MIEIPLRMKILLGIQGVLYFFALTLIAVVVYWVVVGPPKILKNVELAYLEQQVMDLSQAMAEVQQYQIEHAQGRRK